MNTNKYNGSCLCGIVSFEITGEIQDIIYCHCSQCRKAQGSAFATNANVSKNEFHFISGKDELTCFEPQAGHPKYFCKHCGSPIISKNIEYPDRVRIRLGTIESNIIERPQAHIFATSKANWEDITDTLPQHEAYEPKD